MKRFDRERLATYLDSQLGASLLLDEDLEAVANEQRLTPIGRSCISEAVQAAMVEYDDMARALTARAAEALDQAIATAEPALGYGPHELEAYRLSWRMLAAWILDEAILDSWCDGAARAATLAIASERDTGSIAALLPIVLASGEYEAVRTLASRHRLSAGEDWRSIKSPRKMAELLARNMLSGEPGAEQLDGAIRSFLRYLVPNALHLSRAGVATWTDIPLWAYILERHERVQQHGLDKIRRMLEFLPSAAL